MAEEISLAIIGGSGLYGLPGIENVREHDVDTPFGRPSAAILSGSFEDHRIAFLARHGVGHHLTPSEVPYRANIYALKTLGVERILSISACGSLREDLMPGHIVVPDQLFDNTRTRPRSFFDGGLVAHLSVPNPFCPDLSIHVVRAVNEAGGVTHTGGTFITVEGPRFSTKAESNLFRSWGMSLIGMTTAPEAFLAREAEMCYAVMAHVTDFDVWHTSAAPVTVDAVVKTLGKNTQLAQEAVRLLLRRLPSERPCDCAKALAGAIITHRDVVPEATVKRLSPLIQKYIPK
jgi:5'-methylthioadenosine phosphorylase